MTTKTLHRRTKRTELLAILGVAGAAAFAGTVVARRLRSSARSTSAAPVWLFELSVEIKRPPEEVFAFVADLRHDVRWGQRVIKEVRQTSEGPLGVGTTFRQAARFLGLRFAIPIVVTEYEPNRKLGFEAAMGPLQGAARRSVEAIADGTRLTIVSEGHSDGSLKLVWPIFAYWAEREAKTGLANLKNLLEARA